MAVMVTMSKEIRQQFNAAAALRAELEKANKQNEAYRRELRQERNKLSNTHIENTKAIDKNRQLTDENSKLIKQVQDLEVRVQNQRGISFSKLRQ